MSEIAADVILLAPARELAESAPYARNARRVGYRAVVTPLERELRLAADEPLDLYNRQERFLVRTALIRASGWTEQSVGPRIESSSEAAKLCAHLAHVDTEFMVSIALNNQGRLLAIHEVAAGGTSSVPVEIRHLLKVAVLTGATGMIMVHNHPSGDPTPSDDDVRTTKAVKKALECDGRLKLLDHVIIAAGGYRSLYDVGLLDT